MPYELTMSVLRHHPPRLPVFDRPSWRLLRWKLLYKIVSIMKNVGPWVKPPKYYVFTIYLTKIYWMVNCTKKTEWKYFRITSSKPSSCPTSRRSFHGVVVRIPNMLVLCLIRHRLRENYPRMRSVHWLSISPRIRRSWNKWNKWMISCLQIYLAILCACLCSDDIIFSRFSHRCIQKYNYCIYI